MLPDAQALTSLEDISWKLAQTREMRGLSIETIAAALHIRRTYIKALESGDFSLLPTGAYARGYLKRYADFLELDGEGLLQIYDTLATPAQRKFFVLPTLLEKNSYPSGTLVLFTLALAVITVMLTATLRPTNDVPLVVPYRTDFAATQDVWSLPHRCDSNRPSYPPCYWEQREYWLFPQKIRKFWY